eukprot:TRINITY_DN1759_c0_g1_i1.p1 TRINITY_DN1759_c0_g1~~TRINITY_DN1759_c0_g1_i1.p1  ORF type:complete len:237 (+),score=57.48 TRINITY_DN1759_c0_g1_i1:591-1301(+)
MISFGQIIGDGASAALAAFIPAPATPSLPAYIAFRSVADHTVYDGPWEARKMHSWAAVESLPPMGDITDENAGVYLRTDVPVLWLAMDGSAEAAAARREIAPLAAVYRHKLSFVAIDTNTYHGPVEHMMPGVTIFPAVVITTPQVHRYVLPANKEITAANVRAFVDGVLSGTIEPTLRSQPKPARDDAPVKTIVGSTWKEMVIDYNDDVVVLFTADSTSFSSFYLELAAQARNPPH